MVTRLLLILAVLLVGTSARAETVDGVSLTVEVENGEHGFHPQQMILLRVRALFRIPVTLEKLLVPDIPAARTLVIGRDKWTDIMRNGLPARQMERVVAVFPQKSGPFTIPPFVHQVTLADASSKLFKANITSQPLTIEIDPAPVPAGTWWIAAHGMTVSESWSVPPDQLQIGQSTRRTVTFEAVGVMDDQLPPPPELRADGLIAFPGPASRETTIGLGPNQIRDWELPLRERALRKPGRYRNVPSDIDGPVSRVTYTWDVRPTTDRAVLVPAVSIPWYDTSRGEMRTLTIPARTVSLAAASISAEVLSLEKALGIDAPEPRAPADEGWRARLVTAAAAITGFALAGVGLVLLLAPDLVRDRRRSASVRRSRARLIASFRTSARRGHARQTRKALISLRAAGLSPADGGDPDLARLDRHLFDAGAEPPPDWRRLAAVRFVQS